MIITFTAGLARDLAADLEGRAEVYRDDGETAKEAAIDAALAWLNGIGAAVDLLRGEMEAQVPAEHQDEIGLSLDNLLDLAAEQRKRCDDEG